MNKRITRLAEENAMAAIALQQALDEMRWREGDADFVTADKAHKRGWRVTNSDKLEEEMYFLRYDAGRNRVYSWSVRPPYPGQDPAAVFHFVKDGRDYDTDLEPSVYGLDNAKAMKFLRDLTEERASNVR